MKEPSYFVIKRCLLHGPTGRTMVLLRCIRHERYESGFHTKPTRNLQQNKTSLSQTVWQIDCWLEFWYYSVPCARFLSKLWHVCLNVVWTLNIARKHMGGLRLTIDSTNQVGAEHKKCSKPKAQKARIWSKIKAKTCVSKQTCPRMCTRTGSTYPCVSIFFSEPCATWKPSRGFWHKIPNSKNITVSVPNWISSNTASIKTRHGNSVLFGTWKPHRLKVTWNCYGMGWWPLATCLTPCLLHQLTVSQDTNNGSEVEAVVTSNRGGLSPVTDSFPPSHQGGRGTTIERPLPGQQPTKEVYLTALCMNNLQKKCTWPPFPNSVSPHSGFPNSPDHPKAPT